MSNKTRIYGVIDVPRWPGWERAIDQNKKAINELPDKGEWPWLVRGMFHVPPENVSYMSHLISFAATMKGVEDDWPEWIEKFEALLHRMVWSSVRLHLETEQSGDYYCEWRAKIPEGFSPAQESAISEWDFIGPRCF